jgi:hypothetical protein
LPTLLAALLLPACAGAGIAGSSDHSASAGKPAGSVTGTAVSPAAPMSALDTFCADAQALLSNARPRATNVVHTDYDAFVKSKPAVRPLETQQYAWYTPGPEPRLRMISCKMKTADHVRAEYGADAAGEEGECSRLLSLTLDAVRRGFSDAERRRLKFERGQRVVIDPEFRVSMGPVWLEPYSLAYLADDGALHLKSKGMRNDWLDPRLATTPPQFKGTRYCHLIAPGYLRAMLLGEVPPERPPAEPLPVKS